MDKLYDKFPHRIIIHVLCTYSKLYTINYGYSFDNDKR